MDDPGHFLTYQDQDIDPFEYCRNSIDYIDFRNKKYFSIQKYIVDPQFTKHQFECWYGNDEGTVGTLEEPGKERGYKMYGSTDCIKDVHGDVGYIDVNAVYRRGHIDN